MVHRARLPMELKDAGAILENTFDEELFRLTPPISPWHVPIERAIRASTAAGIDMIFRQSRLAPTMQSARAASCSSFTLRLPLRSLRSRRAATAITI